MLRSFCFLLFFFSGISLWNAQTSEYSNIYYQSPQTIRGDFLIKNYVGGALVAGNQDLVSIDAVGDVIWRKKIVSGANLSYIEAVCQTKDSCFAVAGHRVSNVLLMKISGNGDTIWSKGFSFLGSSFVGDIIQTQDSGYAICGWVQITSPPYYRAFVIKTNKFGTAVWSKLCIDSNFENRAFVIRQLSSGALVVAGSTQSINDGSFLCMLDANGNVIWSKSLGFGIGNVVEHIALEIFKGNLLVAMNNQSGISCLLEMNTTGNLLSEKHFLITPQTHSQPSNLSLSILPNKNILLLNTDGFLLTDSLLNFKWSGTGIGELRRAISDGGNGILALTNGPVVGMFWHTAVTDPMFGISKLEQFPTTNSCFVLDSLDKTVATDSVEIFIGTTTVISTGNFFNVYPYLAADSLTSEKACITQLVGAGDLQSTETSVQVFPNPGSGCFTLVCPAEEKLVRLEVLDMGGKSILFPSFNVLSNFTVLMDLSALKPGAYLLRLSFDSKKTTVAKLFIHE